MDYDKLIEDLRAEIAAGASNEDLLEMSSAYAFSKEDLLEVIRRLLSRAGAG